MVGDLDSFDALDNVAKGVSRRGAMGTMAALSVAGIALPEIASAKDGNALSVCEFVGTQSANGMSIEGYFAVPAGARAIEVVVLAPAPDSSTAALREAARGYAERGVYAIVPDLPADRAAMATELDAMLPHLRGIAHGNGRARVVMA